MRVQPAHIPILWRIGPMIGPVLSTIALLCAMAALTAFPVKLDTEVPVSEGETWLLREERQARAHRVERSHGPPHRVSSCNVSPGGRPVSPRPPVSGHRLANGLPAPLRC